MYTNDGIYVKECSEGGGYMSGRDLRMENLKDMRTYLIWREEFMEGERLGLG